MPEPLEVHIRAFRPADAARIRALTIEGFDGVSIDQAIDRTFGPGPYPDWAERKAASVQAWLDAQPERAFVAELNGDVVGYLTTDIVARYRTGRILDMAVDARYRRRGIGSRLIAHALDAFRASGLALARIETLEQNAAGREVYPRHGFVEVARQIHYARRLDGASDASPPPG
ncbi:MAG: GNAT family N-acetyltransferase [Actinobacteria bacterium]|nr:GNAT family N-acetyltransferase [Actinomycetota bacterium]